MTIMKPFVSILIPAFNSQEWIGDTLRSAIAQTWPHKEIIVVDDGSTDPTLAIARQFESESVRVFTQKNQGAAAARNKALSISRGDYIQWLDADDLLAPDKIARQIEALDQAPDKTILLSASWGRFMYRYNRTKFVPTALWCDLSPAEWLLRKMEQNIYMQTSSWLVSRELTDAAGPWDTSLLGDDDGEYFCRVILVSSGVRFVTESKVYYRASGANSLSYIGRSDKKREAQLRSMKLHVGYLRSLDDSQRARAACVTYIQSWLIFFYPERMDLVRQAEQMAGELGGKLEVPHLSWKYSWIRTIFGSRLARHSQIFLPRLRWSVVRFFDKMAFRLENRKHRNVLSPL
jgi:glycosyltransferase involved in cell wall biosynthesis